MTTQRPAHWPALDGLRACAVTSVMLYHLYEPHFFTGGYLGVDVFFVLSGFLITTLAVREWDARGGIGLRAFYLRRALRLFPALAAVLILALVLVATTLHGTLRSQTVSGLPWVVLYVGNWARALSISNLGVLANLWTLAIEEQFYLLWPVVLIALLYRGWSRRRMAGTLAGLALAEVVYRQTLFHHGVSVTRLANGLDTHSDALLLGCALALWLGAGGGRTLPAGWLALAADIAGVGVAVLVLTGNGQSSFQWGYPLTALATGIIVARLVLVDGGVAPTVLASRPMSWVGRRSYGLYVWSYPIYYGIAWPKGFVGLPRDVAEMSLSVAVAAVSYRFIELPFLRRKPRPTARPRHRAARSRHRAARPVTVPGGATRR